MEDVSAQRRNRIAMLASAGLATVPAVYAAHVGVWSLAGAWGAAVGWCVWQALRA
jgi:hypothetical protein